MPETEQGLIARLSAAPNDGADLTYPERLVRGLLDCKVRRIRHLGGGVLDVQPSSNVPSAGWDLIIQNRNDVLALLEREA